jgi:hypothetical protein
VCSICHEHVGSSRFGKSVFCNCTCMSLVVFTTADFVRVGCTACNHEIISVRRYQVSLPTQSEKGE